MKRIVSIQDISCLGQCSLTIALPIISSRGIEVSILPSALMSTHTGGFTGYTCLELTEEMPRIVEHWISEGISFDAIYTGYIGDVRQFELIKYCKERLLLPGGKLIVDPAMADNGRLYSALDSNIVGGMRDIAAFADLIMPNLTEAAFLLNRNYKPSYTKAELTDMLKELSHMGPKEVIITGVSEGENRIGAMSYNAETGDIDEFYTERQPKSYHGTGDIFASIVVADRLNGLSMHECIEDACTFIGKCIQKTLPEKNHEYGVCFEQVLAEERGQRRFKGRVVVHNN